MRFKNGMVFTIITTTTIEGTIKQYLYLNGQVDHMVQFKSTAIIVM